MIFRSLLLCALVSYVAVVTASPIEETLPESEKVDVKNVESTTEDSSLTDLEDISIEGEIIDQDSKEHPESAGLFKNIRQKITSVGRNAANAVRNIPSRVKQVVTRGRNTLRDQGSRSTGSSSHSGIRRPSASSSHSGSRRPSVDRNHRTPGRNNRRDNRRVSASRGSRQNKDKAGPSFGQQLGQDMIISGATALVQGGVSTAMTRANELADSLMGKPKERDNQYYNHPEDDRYDDDDDGDNEDTSDYEDDADECKQLAIEHCFEKVKSSEPKKCMNEYKCSKN